MTKIAGSGSISQRHGFTDPDLDPDRPLNVMDPQHCVEVWRVRPSADVSVIFLSSLTSLIAWDPALFVR
jgi:hypothetical protein